MAAPKIVTVLIKDDGTIDIDQEGWEGKSCASDIKGLIDALGKETRVDNKSEYHRDNQVHIRQGF